MPAIPHIIGSDAHPLTGWHQTTRPSAKAGNHSKRLASARANASQNDPKGTQNDDKIQPQRAMLQIVKIVFQLGAHAVWIVGVALVDLSPSGDAGRDDAAQLEVRNVAGITLAQHQRLGAWTDPAHFALQDIDDLGQFIEPEAAQKRAD